MTKPNTLIHDFAIELAGVTEVHRSGEAVIAVHQAHKFFDQVIHIAERARLGAVAVESDGFDVESLDYEVGHHAPTVGLHRPIDNN